MKRLYGDRIALVGNVNNKVTLVTGSAADVEAEVKECIAAAAWGGLCALLRSRVHDDIPNTNVWDMFEAGRKYGAYDDGAGEVFLRAAHDRNRKEIE